MVSLGPGELTLLVVALVLVFSTGRLPAMGDALGRLLRRQRAGDATAIKSESANAPPPE